MSDSNENDVTELTEEMLEFVQFHKPGLPSGDYSIKMEQVVEAKGIDLNLKKSQDFSVAGNRFDLPPTDIYAVYPPKGSFGEYGTVVPHMVLNRSTMPWERFPDDSNMDSNASWLALLLFDEKEAPQIQVSTIGAEGIKEALNINDLEYGQKDEDSIKVIEVDATFLATIIPSQNDMEYLSHIRLNSLLTTKDSGSESEVIGAERSTLLCNRLPRENANSTVHLVSLENRYVDGSFDFGSDEKVKLLSLFSWEFSCDDSGKGFKYLLANADVNTLRINSDKAENEKTTADLFIDKGYVPLRHAMRMGQKTVSWYRSPLSPAHLEWPVANLPARSADELLHYNEGNGLFDVSYASAWELGRKMVLEDKKISMEIYHWKKELVQENLKTQQKETYATIAIPEPSVETNDSLLITVGEYLVHSNLEDPDEVAPVTIPSSILTFFQKIKRLEGVPFHYLVPNNDMLPEESFRFFRMDPNWVDCLVDGAYSLGDDGERTDTNESEAHEHSNEISGFLLRSEVVSGWPGLLIKAYADNLGEMDEQETQEQEELSILRKTYLDDNVLLVLFSGSIKTADLYLESNTLHYGLDADTDGTDVDEEGDDADPITGKFWQVLRNSEGVEQNESDLSLKTIPFRKSGSNYVLEIKELAVDMVQKIDPENNDDKPTLLDAPELFVSEEGESKLFCAAQFALQMMEGSEKVRILRD